MNQRMYEVLTAIVSYRKSRRVSPTVTELMWMVSVKSKSAVQLALNELIGEGYIAREKRVPRGIKVLKSLPSTFYAAKTADRRKGKTLAEKKQSEAARMKELREMKKVRIEGEAARMDREGAMGRKKDGMDAFSTEGAFFRNGRVTGCKVG
jgi:SOS-response transcriptional repressor LexA